MLEADTNMPVCIQSLETNLNSQKWKNLQANFLIKLHKFNKFFNSEIFISLLLFTVHF